MHLEPVYHVEKGTMQLAGFDVHTLLERFGSPLIVMLEDVIRFNCRAYRKQVEKYPHTKVYYASKAFLCTGMCKLFEQEGMGLDVVSSGELHTALESGFPPEKILLHGNAKTEKELSRALEARVGRIVIDNLDEIKRLGELTQRLGCQAQVLIRVTPGVKPSTHRYVQTGQLDSKFGFNLEGQKALQAAQLVLEQPGLELVGLHCHIGSQIFGSKPFAIAADAMMELYATLKRQYQAPLQELNMGGGLGIRYMPDDYPPSVTEHLEVVRRAVLEASLKYDVEPPILCDEPGRSIIGRAGVTLYTVQSTKIIDGVRNYASVDGGMTDNPRFALYESRHQVLLANRMDEAKDQLWSISGRCCESGDMLAKDVSLPAVQLGDVLAIMSTGAYTYSMASNYNRVARPAVVLAAPERVELLVGRESDQDLIRLDRIPSWL